MILFRGRGLKTEAKIFTGSMADIIFLADHLLRHHLQGRARQDQVDLPDTTVRVTIPESEKPAWIAIASRREGYLIRVSTGEEMSLPDRHRRGARDLRLDRGGAQPGEGLHHQGRQEVPYERFDAVLDALKQSKVKNIYLLSDQKTVDE